ncbi:MAG: hypothetical protein JWR47_1308 [Phenylobacterium sp.]|jgi:hypothetical protein|uniref:NepR family anti-sigma factor n=1 Tax=Phenylobacterium sp. TaxID=1871053 RepID=UPI00262D4939|nr:NepR family anti-sigma factor [Phenylobacterium sp.]MDB5427040.1 hypothetical protein [Phenylobacterium sp.]MDB5435051.1 hypothetical protein [Phenylobacterium sp.]MDB5499198.1 hypothetical protein [Phenylobacterium sp.]
MARKSAGDRAKRQALDKGLKAMFRAVEQRPVPDRILSVAEQLDEGAADPAKKAG